MATKLQYDILRSVYSDQLARCSELMQRSQIYIGICTIIFSGFGIKLNEILACNLWYFYVPAIFAILAFLFAFFTLLISVRSDESESVCDPKEVVSEFEQGIPTDEDFLNDRIIDISVAWQRTKKLNDIKALAIRKAVTFLIIGLILAFFSLAIYSTKEMKNDKKTEFYKEESNKKKSQKIPPKDT